MTIENRVTKKQSTIALSKWKQIKNSPEWKGVFDEVMTINEPPEVTDLKRRQAQAITGK